MIHPSSTTAPLLCKRLVIRGGGGGEDGVTVTEELPSMAMVDSYFECSVIQTTLRERRLHFYPANLQTI